MKNKWLIGLASAMLAVTMVFGFAACGGDETPPADDNNPSTDNPNDPGSTTQTDAEILQEAIDWLKDEYLADVETPRDYEVMGGVKLGAAFYPVQWSVKAKLDTVDISKYVVVGEMDAESKMVPITITPDPVDDIDYILTATVKVNEATAAFEFERTVVHNAIAACDVQLDFSGITDTGTQLAAGTALSVFRAASNIDSEPANITEATQLYAGNASGGAYSGKGGMLKIGKSEGAGTVTIVFAKKVSKVVVLGQGWSSTEGCKIAVNGATAQDLSKDAMSAVEFELETPTDTVTIVSEYRGFIFGIGAVYATGVHNHVWGSYIHVEGEFAHTKTCTAEGCDLQGPQKEDCQVVDNVCALCNTTYTETQILDGLFALAQGGSLPGTYKLKGTVVVGTTYDSDSKSNVATPFVSTSFSNVTFDIKIGERTITVYRAKGDGYDTVKVGDTVTVSGELIDYKGTKEFTSGCTILEIIDNSSTMDDQAKANAAKEAVTLDKTVFSTASETLTLPTAGLYDTTIAWSIQTASQYASVSENTLTIGSALPTDEDATVTLHYVVTCGDKTAEGDITITVKKQYTLVGAGTQESPYTVEDAIYLVRDLENNTYYQGNTRLYFKGYVTNVGSANMSSGTDYVGLKNVLIATEKGGSVTLQLSQLYFDETVFPSNGDSNVNPLHVGDYVVVGGFLEKFSGNAALYASENKSEHPQLVVWTKAEISNQAKAGEVVAALNVSKKDFYSGDEDVDLPTTTLATEYSADVKWEVSRNEYLEIATGNKLHLKGTPTGEDVVEVTLTLTVTVSNDGTATTTFTLKVHPANAEPEKGTADNPYTVDELKDIESGLSTSSTANDDNYYKVDGVVTPIYVEGIITVVGTADGGYGIKDYYFATTAGDTDNDIKFKANWGDVDKNTTFRVGDTVVVYGYFEYYSGEYQIGLWKDGNNKYNNALLKSHTPKQLTNEEKAQEVLDSLTLSQTVFTKEDKTGIDLPVASGNEYNAQIEWEVVDTPNAYVSIDSNKLLINTLPTENDEMVTLKVTVTVGSDAVNKTVEITVKKQVVLEDGEKAGTYTFTIDSITDFEDAYKSYDWKATDSNGTLTGKLYAYKETTTPAVQLNITRDGFAVVNTSATPGPITSVKVVGVTEASWQLFTNAVPYSEMDKAPTAGKDQGAKTVVTATTGTTWSVTDSDAYFFTLVLKSSGAQKIKSIEITYQGKPMSDELKATSALNAITFEETQLKTDVTLPTSVLAGVTFNWTAKNGGAAATVENNTTLKIVRQDADVDFTLEVTATSGEHTTEARSIPLKVVAKPAEGVKESVLLYTLTTPQGSSGSSYASTWSETVDGIKWNLTNVKTSQDDAGWRFGGKSLTKADSTLTSAQTIAGTVKQVVIKFGTKTITVNSATLKVYNSDPTAADASPIATKTIECEENGVVTIDVDTDDWTNCYYQLVFNVTNSSTSNKYVQLKSIVFNGYAPD